MGPGGELLAALSRGCRQWGVERFFGVSAEGVASNAPYSWSEVIHRSGAKAPQKALERERPQIVNNFAPRRVSRYELTPHPDPRRIFGEFRAVDLPGVQNNTQTMTRARLWRSYVSL